jgi:hypothetical protein
VVDWTHGEREESHLEEARDVRHGRDHDRGAALECGNDPMPQACLSAKLEDSGNVQDVRDVVTEPQVCLTMPPPDSGDDASDASDASDAADAKG